MDPHAIMEKKIRYTFFPTEQLGPFWAETLAKNFRNEPHLSQEHPATLRDAASHRRMLVAYDKENDLLVGCAVMWPLGESDEGMWLKFGTMFLIEPYRFHHSEMKISDEICRRMLNAFPKENILASTTNRAAVHAGLRAGFVRIRYEDLPLNIRRATCTCPALKTGEANPLMCRLADVTCFACVSRETYERLHRPESPPFPS